MLILLINGLSFSPDPYNTAAQMRLSVDSFLSYEILYRHLRFQNGTRIDTSAEIQGTQNGTLTLNVEEIQSANQVTLRFSLDLLNKHHDEKRILFEPRSQLCWLQNNSSVYLGFTHLWFNISEVRDTRNFTMSYNELLRIEALASLKGTTTIDLEELGLQEVQELRVNATYGSSQYVWTSFYDRDTNLLLRMVGDPSDPVLLGLFGVETLDFALSLDETNLDIGQPAGTVAPPPQVPFSVIFIIAGVVVFTASFILLSLKRSKSKSHRRIKKNIRISTASGDRHPWKTS
jgi:hypothetical protein